jgi:hypothetical protein
MKGINWRLSALFLPQTDKNQTHSSTKEWVWRPQLPLGFARRAQTKINVKGSCGTFNHYRSRIGKIKLISLDSPSREMGNHHGLELEWRLVDK